MGAVRRREGGDGLGEAAEVAVRAVVGRGGGPGEFALYDGGDLVPADAGRDDEEGGAGLLGGFAERGVLPYGDAAPGVRPTRSVDRAPTARIRVPGWPGDGRRVR